jgi:hypothetical protein
VIGPETLAYPIRETSDITRCWGLVELITSHDMLVASTRSAFARANHLTRSFATTARAAQATPVQKPVLEKEFKIYRWVRVFLVPRASYSPNNQTSRF